MEYFLRYLDREGPWRQHERQKGWAMEHENCSMLFRNIKHAELSFDFAQIKTIEVMGKSTMSFSAIYKDRAEKVGRK